MTNLAQIDGHDFDILSIIAASGHSKISSWKICQALYPNDKRAQNHLSSVIWRLDKLVGLNFLQRHPHPTRAGKKVYSLPEYAFSVNGTVFIPSPIGGIIVNCRYKENCNPCRFGAKECALSAAILKDGLEPVLRIAERLAKLKSNLIKKEAKNHECNSHQAPELHAIQS